MSLALDDRLRREGRVPLADVVRLVRDACEELITLHASGVVHRKLHPAAVLVDQRGRARLLDRVPAASWLDAGPPSAFSRFVYMAPEQVRGQTVDGRADVYGLAAIAFHALTGRPPFVGASALALIAKKLDHDPPSLCEASAEGETWPAPLERFFARALARDPDARFADAAEALRAWIALLPS